MIEHCISALSQFNKEKSYQYYVTSCLQAIARNTASLVNVYVEHKSLGCQYQEKSFYELMNPTTKTEEKTGDEIAEDVLNKLGIGGV